MSRKGGSSQRWKARQQRDPYVERATQQGFRARSAFKLEEIQKKEKLIRRGMVVVDLGSSPGSWSQYAAKIAGGDDCVLAVDLLAMDPIPGVRFTQGDFSSESIRDALREQLGGRPVGLVMSDMAPNISGNRVVDQARSLELAEEALRFAEETLGPKGHFLVKLFQGYGLDDFERAARNLFTKVSLLKPRASRPESREIYLLARNFRM